MVNQESRFNPKARGSHGEIGLMQIKPTTALWIAHHRHMGEPTRNDLFDPCINIKVGTAYVSWLRHSFEYVSPHYISAYNLGPKELHTRLRNNHHLGDYRTHVLRKYVAYYQELQQTDRFFTTLSQIAWSDSYLNSGLFRKSTVASAGMPGIN